MKTETSTDLASLRQEMNELRASLASMQSNGHGPGSSFLAAAESNHATDRRSMLKKVGAMAAGVAAVGLLRPSSSSAANYGYAGGAKEGAAPAATGGNFILGTTNAASGTDTTTLIAPGSVVLPALFRVDNYSAGSLGAPPTGSTAAGLFHCNNASGTPTSGTFYAVYAHAQAAAGGLTVGVYGLGGSLAAPTGYGVYGVGGIGVFGQGSGNGCGVDGSITGTTTSAYAMRGIASGMGGGAFFSGPRAAIILGVGTGAVANPNASTPSGGGQGDFYRGSTLGSVWYNAGGTNPYRKLAGSDTAGAVHILATPRRYVDTRNGTGGVTAPYNNGTVRSYNFVTLQAGTIPAGARGVFGNITAASPGGNGNYQTNTINSFPVGSAAVMNFTPGVNLSNHFVGALDTNGLLYIRGNVLSGSGQVQLVIDIYGYFI